MEASNGMWPCVAMCWMQVNIFNMILDISNQCLIRIRIIRIQGGRGVFMECLYA